MTEKRKKTKISANLSIWALLAGGSFYKILTVLSIMVLTEGALFYRALYSGNTLKNFQKIMTEGCAQILFLAALGMIFLILVLMEGKLDNKSRYTLMRLKITQPRFFVIETAYNVLCLTILFAVQAGMAFWMVWQYKNMLAPEQAGQQFFFLTFYRNEFLHCLLPMADTGKWVRNALLLLAFGMGAACKGIKRKYVLPIALYAVTISWFTSPMGSAGNFTDRRSMDSGCFIFYSVVIVISVGNTLQKQYRKV